MCEGIKAPKAERVLVDAGDGGDGLMVTSRFTSLSIALKSDERSIGRNILDKGT